MRKLLTMRTPLEIKPGAAADIPPGLDCRKIFAAFFCRGVEAGCRNSDTGRVVTA
jgi:hypothetical protein